ncbi:hypothetical protein BJ878DRAFT_113213 [Calycina marina]|uniref:Uncharacterized protein n=1 Tax=Calycina marina TaxID=1763456 RepID=A0A9P7Z1J8_9HELO|nr:hypothetical protein BJ878DRAFT_113213 [Calycina marina]
MANIDDLSKYNQENLLSILGYEKHSPTRNAGALKAEVKAYLAEYEFRGQKIPPLHRRNPAEARLCAYNFLEEDGRAERLFALNLDERLTWSADRATIVEAVAHLFRIRALNNHQNEIGAQQRVEKKICSHYATVETDCDGAESPSPSRKRARRSDVGKGSPAKRRREVESSPELDYQDVVALDAEYSLKPWAKASKRLNSQTAIHHIDSLNPAKRPDNIPEFTLDWLMDGLPWPVAADPELASFMHKWNFYVAENISSDVLHLGSYREVVDTLRSGTQLASLNGPRYQKFEKRVGERIEHLTGWFFKECFLENGIDGSLRKTKRFQELVDSRERVWKQEFETIASFENTLRRKKKVSRQPSALKSPVVFPNILHSPQQPNLRGDLREMADNVLEHLNKGLSVEEHDEYIVITPDLPAKVVLPEADPMEKYSATNTFFLDDSTASVPPKQPAPSPPRKLPVLAPAPPVTKMVVEELHHDEENLHRATKLHHCLTPESLRQVQSSISLARNHSHEVEEPSSVFGVTTEDPRKAVAATESPTITLAPEEEYAPKFAVKSDLLKACIAQGLKVLPGLNEAVQAELWRLHFWQHPDNISTFTLQSFCTKYQIPSIAKYTEWWTLQDEEQRTKRLQPNQRIPHAANAPSVTASDASTVHAYTFVASPPVAHEKHDQKFQALITGEQAAVKPVSPGSNAYHQSKGQTSFSSQWCTAKQNLQLKPSQSDNETRKNKHDSAERLQESRSTNQ